jgi:hypothetical protein
MKQTMIRYKVKPDRVAENERFITQVFEALDREQPRGLRYASFKLPDGVSFVHVVAHESKGPSPLQQIAAFKAFTADIRDRCDEQPTVVDLATVGSYSSID